MRRSDSGLKALPPPLLNRERGCFDEESRISCYTFSLYLYSDKKEVKFQTGQRKNKKKGSGSVLMEY